MFAGEGSRLVAFSDRRVGLCGRRLSTGLHALDQVLITQRDAAALLAESIANIPVPKQVNMIKEKTMSESISEAKQLCLQLIKAYEEGDEALLRDVYAPDARVWHDFEGINTFAAGAQSVDENVATMLRLNTVADGISYDTLRLEDTESGFVEVHELTGSNKAGAPFSALAVLIGTVRNGKISRLDELINMSNMSALTG